MRSVPRIARLLGLACLLGVASLTACGGDSVGSPQGPGPSRSIPGVNTDGIIAYGHSPSGVKVKVPETFRLLLDTDSSFFLSLEADTAILLMSFTRQAPGESLDALEAQYRGFGAAYTVTRGRRGEVDGLDLRTRQQLPAGTRYLFTHFLDQDRARLKIGYSVEEGRMGAWESLAKAIVESATLK